MYRQRKGTHTERACVWARARSPLVSASRGLSSYCVSAFYWQSLSPAKRDYKYKPRIANRMVDAFCSASCPSCYDLCHGNEPSEFHSLNILSTPHSCVWRAYLWVSLWSPCLDKDDCKSWPALRGPGVLSGREWLATANCHLPSTSTRIKSYIAAAADLCHPLKGVQGGDQK